MKKSTFNEIIEEKESYTTTESERLSESFDAEGNLNSAQAKGLKVLKRDDTGQRPQVAGVKKKKFLGLQ